MIGAAGHQPDGELGVGGHRGVDLALRLRQAILLEIDERQIGVRDGIERVELDRPKQRRLGLAVRAPRAQHQAEAVPDGRRAGSELRCTLQIGKRTRHVALEAGAIVGAGLQGGRVVRVERERPIDRFPHLLPVIQE